MADIVLREVDPLRFFHNTGFLLPKPQKLGKRPGRADGVHRVLFQNVRILLLDSCALLAAPRIGPVDKPAQRTIVPVAQHGHMRRGVNADCDDVSAVRSGHGNTLTDILQDGFVQFVCVLFQPPGLRRVRRVFLHR